MARLQCLMLFTAFLLQTPIANAWDRLSIYDEITATAEREFFDPNMSGVDWHELVAQYRTRVDNAMSHEAFSLVVNELLEHLGASHTSYLTPQDPRWYQLVGIFIDTNEELQANLENYLPDSAPTYVGIGVMLHQQDNRFFISGVLEGFPAAEAGLLVGDRIISVSNTPFHPIESFQGYPQREISLLIERRPGERLTIEVTPTLLDGRSMFETAMRESSRLIEQGDKSIGYIRAWSYAGIKYQQILVSELLNGTLANADALVLDLRGGWGGADLTYLNLFIDQNVQAKAVGRDGEPIRFASGWDKPVVLLVDEGSRSGKELNAYGFRQLRKGVIVGEKTAGAVLAGYPFSFADGSVLYLATLDVFVGEQRLEGVGVEPDVLVPFDPAYAAGADPQLDRALQEAVQQIR